MSELKTQAVLSNDNNAVNRDVAERDLQHEDPLDLEAMTRAVDEIGFAQCDNKGKPVLDAQGNQVYVPWAQVQRPKVTLQDPVSSDEVLIVKIRQTAYAREVARVYQDIYKELLSDPEFVSKNIPDPVFQKYVFNRQEKARTKAEPKTCAMVVLNFKPDVDISQDPYVHSLIERDILKAAKKGFIKDWMFSWEQRGFDTDPQSPHAIGVGNHVNFVFTYDSKYKKPLTPSLVVDGFYQLFKDYLGSKSAISVRLGTDPTNFINYVLGIKADPEKQQLVEADRMWREAIGLEPFYASSQWYVISDNNN